MLGYWTHPDSYAGFSPDGDILVYSIHGGADALARTNWNAALARLLAASGQGKPGEPQGGWQATRPNEAVYTWEASCSLAGWRRYLMVRADAPPAVIAECEAIASELAAYPSLDDDAWGELEWKEANDMWRDCFTVRERAALIRDHAPECSIFAARRPWLPEGEHGGLYDWLRG